MYQSPNDNINIKSGLPATPTSRTPARANTRDTGRREDSPNRYSLNRSEGAKGRERRAGREEESSPSRAPRSGSRRDAKDSGTLGTDQGGGVRTPSPLLKAQGSPSMGRGTYSGDKAGNLAGITNFENMDKRHASDQKRVVSPQRCVIGYA